MREENYSVTLEAHLQILLNRLQFKIQFKNEDINWLKTLDLPKNVSNGVYSPCGDFSFSRKHKGMFLFTVGSLALGL